MCPFFSWSASVEGRVFVWKIDEGPDLENKPQITGGVVIALQLVGDAESYHPRVCWHSHKQVWLSLLELSIQKIIKFFFICQFFILLTNSTLFRSCEVNALEVKTLRMSLEILNPFLCNLFAGNFNCWDWKMCFKDRPDKSWKGQGVFCWRTSQVPFGQACWWSATYW